MDNQTHYKIHISKLNEVYLTVNPLPTIDNDETVAYCLNSFPTTITLDAGLNENATNFSFNWSNSETGKGHNNWYRPNSQLIQFYEKCSVVAYKIDPKNNQSSFISNC